MQHADGVTIGTTEKVNKAKGSAAQDECVGQRGKKSRQ